MKLNETFEIVEGVSCVIKKRLINVSTGVRVEYTIQLRKLGLNNHIIEEKHSRNNNPLEDTTELMYLARKFQRNG